MWMLWIWCERSKKCFLANFTLKKKYKKLYLNYYLFQISNNFFTLRFLVNNNIFILKKNGRTIISNTCII